jgi:glutamyl-tRNA reductase
MENTFVLGISFKNADVTTRSAFSIPVEKQKECYDLAKSYQFKDFVVLSTCNRTELYGSGSVEHAEKIITTVTCQSKLLLDSYKYVKTSEDALTHIFYVASGLDSQILGDYQILGQFKTACKFSKENGLLGPVFERMANVCIQASKEIKTKTDLSKGTVSASYAAIEILKEKIGERPAKCLLIGTGKFGNKISKNIKHYLPDYELTVSNRTYSTALEIANANGFGILPFDQINEHIRDFEVIILCSASNRYLVTPQSLLDAKTKLILDLSIPQTVHPDCKTMSGIEVLDIDSISAILERSIENRKIYLPIANEIIHNHISSFVDWNNFQEKREQIVSLKNTLIEFSKYCPHLTKMDEAAKDELVNKTIKSFILNLKQDNNMELDSEKVIEKFMQYAEVN